MHTEGVEERLEETGAEVWLVRSECGGCGLSVGVEAPPDQAVALVDRLLWTDDARHELDRLPPYLQTLVGPEVEDYARANGHRLITMAVLTRARIGGEVEWNPEALRRLENIPSAVKAMARVELERTALDRGQGQVTVVLMEEVKARYFGAQDRARGDGQ
jgi:hypothetical protein